jgi:hypothetical protein
MGLEPVSDYAKTPVWLGKLSFLGVEYILKPNFALQQHFSETEPSFHAVYFGFWSDNFHDSHAILLSASSSMCAGGKNV